MVQILIAAAGSQAHAAKVLRSSAGAIAHWQAPAIRVALSGAAPSSQLTAEASSEAVARAVASWNALPEMKRRFVASTAPSPEIVIEFCRGTWKNATGLLAHTEFVAAPATGVISTATIQVNECDFEFLAPDEVFEGKYDLESVLAHELGHALGLDHSDDAEALMFTSTGNARQRLPNRDDRTALAMVFGLPAPAPDAATELAAPVQASHASVGYLTAAAEPDALPPARPAFFRKSRFEAPDAVLAALHLEGAVLYTCEPTLLPAMGDAEVAEIPRRSRSSSVRTTSARSRRR